MQFRRPSVGLTLTLVFLVFASSASAAVRYASPGASGAEPCNPTPCTLQKAVNGAGDGDQVMVAAGTYKPTVEVEVDHAISVGGAPGAALPTVQISNHFLHEDNAAALVHDLRIEVVAPTMPYAITDEAGSVERVYAYSFESAGACQIASGVLRDSVCWGGLYAAGFGGGNVHIVLRNVTATSTVMGAGGGANVTIDGANLIMHSIDPAQSNGADLAVDVSAGASASISLTHSNYASVDAAASSGTTFSYTPPGTNGNQTAPPLFVDAAAGNLHELAGSPTIDAGIADPLDRRHRHRRRSTLPAVVLPGWRPHPGHRRLRVRAHRRLSPAGEPEALEPLPLREAEAKQEERDGHSGDPRAGSGDPDPER